MSGSDSDAAAAPAKQPLIMQYYLHQGIIRPEEAAQVRATLEAPLPACFRVNPMTSVAPRIIDRLTNEFPEAFASVAHLEGQPLTPPRELSWYSAKNGRAWQLDCGKAALSRGARDNSAIQDFRAFLLHHTAEGDLSRQEAVSMVPALLLDVHPHHRVLDMCAAPGSKTAQIMEALVSDARNAEGFVVANDANEKRGYLLVHQLQRLGLDNFVVTCHEGQNFPGLGDGTIRKNRNLWGRWAPGSALTLHPTQIDLGLRAAALLRDNGDSIMTYSTCSMNPVENEAVVAELLRRADGALELVDCSTMLPGLITRPGVTSWNVAWQARTAKGEPRAPLQWFDRYEGVPDFLQGSRILRSMFPPTSEEDRSILTRCMRLFPTDQNTGGFFVAVLRKVRDASLPGKTQRGLDSYEVAATISGERRPSRRVKKLVEQGIELPQLVEAIEQPAKVENQTYSKLRADHWEEIKEFYGISGSFPQENLYSRSEGTASVCLVNPSIRSAIFAGEHANILDTGLRVFARVQAAGKLVFRPTDEGLERVLPFISNRKAPATIADLVAIVTVPANNTKQVALGLEHFSEPLQEAAAAVREDSGVGPMLMVLPLSEVNARQLPAALPVWLGDKTLTLLVDKHTRDRLAHKSRE
ncbi:tRNA (cytosine-5-)-methyltransferase NSUN2-like protein [Phytophthora cinnamomi]|uniref:tRNA (cytosine-5-)-methyltransferase NSUN2-like protein n=1 Tax=Phytophthora cinnamomi TaxID=4785 RepID=UPI003559E198|nr:tRNA (cytosine-5-)-methyltransferase NSUN2-like protein [Phytophthora cinnamomi]